ARNLTDKQLAAIAESDGMVGLNFACAFLREDGQMDRDTPLDTMLRHLDYMIEKLGEDRIGLGSDFDGAWVPDQITDVAGLNNLRAAMRAHGYDEPLMRKLCHENWLRVLDKTWKE
ncbi:MAG TPA: peptidase M19, partial [Rhodobacteraceae bacterium]|nr:peptidase M19 [Paracoccaceae bacterium]